MTPPAPRGLARKAHRIPLVKPQGWFIRGDGSQDGFYDARWFSERFSWLGCELLEEGSDRLRVRFIGLHAVGGRREIRGKNPRHHDGHIYSNGSKLEGQSFHCELDCSLTRGVDTRTQPGNFA